MVGERVGRRWTDLSNIDDEDSLNVRQVDIITVGHTRDFRSARKCGVIGTHSDSSNYSSRYHPLK